MAQINPKDVAITVAIVAGLFVGYKVVKGLGSAGDAVGGALSSAAGAVGEGAEAVGDAIAGGWNWVTGFFSSDPTVSVFDDAAMRRISEGINQPTNPNPYNDNTAPPISGGGRLTMPSIGGGSILSGGGSFESGRNGYTTGSFY